MAGHAHTVLLLESDDATRDLYRRELSRRYQVVCSEDVQEAMTIVRSGTAQALILEPAWCNESGWQLMDLIGRLPDRQRIPIVVVTVLDQRCQGLQLGAAAYCIKPVLPTTLLDLLKQILAD